jgi:hypothetical protein
VWCWVALGSLVTLMVPETMPAMQAFTAWFHRICRLAGLRADGGCLCAVPGHRLDWVSPVLDGLTLGEATARSLGLPLGPLRLALVAVMALATGAAVAQTGLIAFVGLAAPHLVRSVVRTTHARLVGLSALAGGVLLLAADLLARSWIAPQELPVGVLTAVLGGGYLLWLMHRGRGAKGARCERRGYADAGRARHMRWVASRSCTGSTCPCRPGAGPASSGPTARANPPCSRCWAACCRTPARCVCSARRCRPCRAGNGPGSWPGSGRAKARPKT